MPQKVQLAVGLDAGASRTRCVICALDGEYIRYLGHGLAVSAGWARGRLADQEAVSESIRAAVSDAEQDAGVQVDGLTVGVGGAHIEGGQSRGLYEFGRPHEADSADMAYAAERAPQVRLERGRRLLHLLPQGLILQRRP